MTMIPREHLFNFHPMIARLEHLSQIPEIEVLHADFNTGEVVVTFKEPCQSFADVINRIKFCEMSKRLTVQSANFQTGEITVIVLDTDKNEDLTSEEISYLKANQIINAIKAVRHRTGMGLADAKRHVEDARDKLRARGVLPR